MSREREGERDNSFQLYAICTWITVIIISPRVLSWGTEHTAKTKECTHLSMDAGGRGVRVGFIEEAM
jgi:p-aminobenzoyl-glutamate transporter AbgT